MRHVLVALSLPLLIVACNARVLPSDSAGDGAEDLSNTGAGKNAPDAGNGSLPGCPTEPDAGPSDGSTGATGTCSTPDGTRHSFTSEADVLARLKGPWLTCGGFIIQPSGTIGIEFEGSKAWFLVEGPKGSVVRGSGSTYERTVSIVDTIAMNGPGPYRYWMTLTQQNGSSDNYLLDSYDHPSKLVLNEGTTGNVAEYVPSSGAAYDGGVEGDAGFSYDGGGTVYDGGYSYDGGGYVYDGGYSYDGGGYVYDGGYSYDGGGYVSDGGTGYDDAGFEDAPSTSSCSLVGTWAATSNVPFGNLSSFVFSANGTFIGGPLSATLPAGETFSGDWSIASDGEVSISNTTGMLCNAGPTNMSLTYSADCATVTLNVVTDACTGAREQLDDTTVLVRR